MAFRMLGVTSADNIQACSYLCGLVAKLGVRTRPRPSGGSGTMRHKRHDNLSAYARVGSETVQSETIA